jgi:hypothetical protein
MTIPPEIEAQILRYYHVEKWRIGTIARQLHLHHGTVMRVLAQSGMPRTGPPARRSQIEPYLPFVIETLRKFPTLTASRLHAMVRERGYRGTEVADHQCGTQPSSSSSSPPSKTAGSASGSCRDAVAAIAGDTLNSRRRICRKAADNFAATCSSRASLMTGLGGADASGPSSRRIFYA